MIEFKTTTPENEDAILILVNMGDRYNIIVTGNYYSDDDGAFYDNDGNEIEEHTYGTVIGWCEMPEYKVI